MINRLLCIRNKQVLCSLDNVTVLVINLQGFKTKDCSFGIVAVPANCLEALASSLVLWSMLFLV